MAEKSRQEKAVSEISPSVQSHLGIIQGVIERMASNSASAKTWNITIVSAILVAVTANEGKSEYIYIAFFPTLLFAMLDAYYLGMEKGFRNSYDQFVKKLHSGTATAEDLFSVQPIGKTSQLLRDSLKSFSIWGFYLGITILIFLTKFLL